MLASEQTIKTHYRYQQITRNLKTKLDKSLIDQIRVATSSQLTINVPKIRPLWLCFLGDALNGNALDVYGSYTDYAEMLSDVSIIKSAGLAKLTNNQSYVINAKGGNISISVETVVRDETNKTAKPTRSETPLSNGAVSACIINYVRKCLKSFIPTMVTNYLQCVKANRVDIRQIEANDVRFSDYLSFNVDGAVCVTKASFLDNCQPLDFYYAVNYHPNPNMNTLSLPALYTLYLTAPQIGHHLYTNAQIMADTDFIGSCAISVSSGKAEKKIFTARSDSPGVSLRPTTSRIVEESDDLTNSLLLSAFPTITSAMSTTVPPTITPTARPTDVNYEPTFDTI